MTIERAIEILDPDHRECYDSIETVNEACKMGQQALMRQIPMKPEVKNGRQRCPFCWARLLEPDNYCPECGQALDWSDLYD